MRLSATVFALSAVAANADGVRKIGKSGSEANADGSWWGPAPAPATWGPAPTWAAPAPATWAAPATWSAPAPTPPADAGCRALWLRGISESTFSDDVCTISGYLTRKFAEKGPLGGTEKITPATASEGFQTLINPVSLTTITLAANAADNTVIAANPMGGGYAADMITSTLINPLGVTGMKYCACVAVAVRGCDPEHSAYAIGEAADIILLGTAASHLAADFRIVNNLGTQAGTAVSKYQKEYTGLALQFTQAMKRDGTDTEVNDEAEKDSILKIVKHLPKSLDQCAPVAIDLAH